MVAKFASDNVPDRFAEVYVMAMDWWRDAAVVLLPGEQGGEKVFEVQFWDGCRYIGHTERNLFERVDDLVASPFDERRSVFVAEHCARMGSVVRCIASDLDPAAAAELRDELVLNAPDGLRNVDEASLEAEDCFLAEVAKEPVRLTFAEWIKTREEPEPGGEC